MGKENIKELNNKLDIEKTCAACCLVASVVLAVIELITFIMNKDVSSIRVMSYELFGAAVMTLLVRIMNEVKKNETPFTKSISKKVLIIGIIIMFAAVVPDLVVEIINICSGTTQFDLKVIVMDTILSSKNLFVMFIGVIVSVFSEIFSYGVNLQADNDSIA